MKSRSCPRLGANSVVVVAFGWMSATKAAMRETATWLGKKKLGGGFIFLFLFGDGFLWFHVFFLNLTLVGGGFMFMLLLLLFGEDSHFDYYF